MLETILLDTIKELYERGIPFVQLRPKKISQQEIDNGDDFDFLVCPKNMLTLKMSIVKNVMNLGAHVIIHENSEKVQISCLKDLTSSPIIIDIWKEYLIKRNSNSCLLYLRLEDLERYLLDDGKRLHFPADIEALLFITHLSTKKKVLANSNVVNRRLHYIDSVSVKEPSRSLFFSSVIVDEIISIFKNLGTENLDSSSDACLDILQSEGIPLRKRAHIDELWTRVNNAIHRRVSVAMNMDCKIPVTGPDGVGKTTIIEWMAKRFSLSTVGFKSFFRFNRIYPVIQRFYPGYRRHDQNVVDESLSSFWYWIALFYFVREYWKKAAQKGIIIDRYFHDLILKNVRKDQGSIGFRFYSRIEAVCIPKPKIIIQLYGPPDTIFQRKKELSIQKISEYNYLTSELYCGLSTEYYLIVNTDTPLKVTKEFIENSLNGVFKEKTFNCSST